MLRNVEMVAKVPSLQGIAGGVLRGAFRLANPEAYGVYFTHLTSFAKMADAAALAGSHQRSHTPHCLLGS
jgi:hypothetical protein